MTPTKATLRGTFLARRAALSASTRSAAAAMLSRHVSQAVSAAGAARIAAYVPVGTEPGSLSCLDELRAGGIEVWLPVLRDDLELDWVRFEGVSALLPAAHGLLQPTGPRMAVETISQVDLVIVPALAVDAVGNRLGRGGGSYDRTLARVAGHVPVVALLHDGERVPALPYEAHDRPVTHAVTPAQGWHPLATR